MTTRTAVNQITTMRLGSGTEDSRVEQVKPLTPDELMLIAGGEAVVNTI